MSLDLTLLQVMKHRKEYKKLIRTVNDRAVDSKTKIILDDFGKYFEQVPECEVIPLTGAFLTFFTTVAHRTLKPEDAAVYRAMFTQAQEEVDETTKSMLIAKLLEADLAVESADLAERWQRGEEVDLPKLLRGMVDRYETDVKRKVKLPFVELNDQLFEEDVNNTGYTWAWECLNNTMRPLRGGDFIILAGRPDKGKTTAVAQHLAHMAKQVKDMHPEGGKHILWFNNEGPGKRIMKRLIQSALGCPMSAIIKKQNEGVLWDEYTAAIGGDKFLIKVMDIHGFRSWQVEEVMRQLPPAIAVFDMIDNIRFDGEMINGGQRTDQMLEAMYQWGRDLAVRFDCPVIATSQISADGDGLPFPTLSMLKDSKTGKQGAADAIITLGAKNEKAFENLRFIGLTKNKLALEGRPKSPHAELVLDGPAGRYLEAG